MSLSTENAERALKFLLRAIGGVSLPALIFVAAPYSWMDAIHAQLGMGPLADQPVVGYLARSTSAFYALLGGLMWAVSFDLQRHRVVLTYLGIAFCCFGVILLAVDWLEGLPLFWKLWEGPFVITLGIAMLHLAQKIKSGTESVD